MIAVKFEAVFQAAPEGPLRHPGVEDLPLELVDGPLSHSVRGAGGGGEDQGHRESTDADGDIEMKKESDGGPHGSPELEDDRRRAPCRNR